MCAAPLSVIVLPEARYAYVVTFESAMLMAGATATPVAEAPVFASVFIRFVVIADTLRSCPLGTSVSMPASVTSSMIATATDAPTPTEPAPVTPDTVASVGPSAGRALVLVLESEAAATETFPVCALITAPAGITAVVCRFTMLIATEPAMPTSPPPAPLVAVA